MATALSVCTPHGAVGYERVGRAKRGRRLEFSGAMGGCVTERTTDYSRRVGAAGGRTGECSSATVQRPAGYAARDKQKPRVLERAALQALDVNAFVVVAQNTSFAAPAPNERKSHRPERASQSRDAEESAGVPAARNASKARCIQRGSGSSTARVQNRSRHWDIERDKTTAAAERAQAVRDGHQAHAKSSAKEICIATYRTETLFDAGSDSTSSTSRALLLRTLGATCLRMWHEYALDAASVRRLTLRLLVMSSRVAAMRRSFMTWQQTTVQLRTRRQQDAAIASKAQKRERRLKQKSMLAFTRAVVVSKLIAHMHTRAQCRLVARCLRAWRRNSRTAVALDLGSSRRRWYAPSSSPRSAVSECKCASEKDRAFLYSVFDIWCIFVGASLTRRESILRAVSGRRAVIRIVRCMTEWKRRTFSRSISSGSPLENAGVLVNDDFCRDKDEDEDSCRYEASALERGVSSVSTSVRTPTEGRVVAIDFYDAYRTHRGSWRALTAIDMRCEPPRRTELHEQLMADVRLCGFMRDRASNARRYMLLQIAMSVWALACYASRDLRQKQRIALASMPASVNM